MYIIYIGKLEIAIQWRYLLVNKVLDKTLGVFFLTQNHNMNEPSGKYFFKRENIPVRCTTYLMLVLLIR